MAHKYKLEDAVAEGKQKAKVEKLRSEGYSETDALLISMKKDKKKENKESPSMAPDSPGEVYPYGLRLRLENDELKKLGITELPEVGKVCKIEAEGVVESVSSSHNKDSEGPRKSVEVQITALVLDKSENDKAY